jgi:tRNA (guanine-N7-)-methyltransferase
VPRVRQHVNPLKSDLLEIADVPRVTVVPGQPLEVELGAAEAHFLLDRGAAEPDTLFVGIEIRRELVEATNADCARRGIRNVRLIFANMSVDLPRLFQPGGVRRFFLNFPDPWFKSRQHKRRVINPGLVAELARALQPGGELWVMTDIFELALDAMAALETSPLYESAAGAWTFARANPYGAKSRRERQCEQEGAPIWRLLYRRVGSAV